MVYVEILNKYDFRNISPMVFTNIGDEFEGYIDSVRDTVDRDFGKVSYLYGYHIDDKLQVQIYGIRIGFGLSHVDWNAYIGHKFKIVLDRVNYSKEYNKKYNIYKVYIDMDKTT